MMKTIVILIGLLLCNANSEANYSAEQDTAIIGKSLWVYYDKETCRNDVKIYPSQTDSDPYFYNQPIEISVNNLNKTPFNWTAGRWYSVTLKNLDNSNGHIVYDTLNSNHGYTKNLYYIVDKNNFDLVLLQSACVTNLSPSEINKIFVKVNEEKLAHERIIDQENDRKRTERELKIQSDLADETKREEKLIADSIQADKDRQALTLKNAPKNIKSLTSSEFCELYGYMIRDQDIPDFGTASDMKKIMINEASRRKVKVNTKLVKGQLLKLGISTCELYASWGLPNDENKSVGSFGVHIQHVYSSSGVYVYSENGRVSSWQE